MISILVVLLGSSQNDNSRHAESLFLENKMAKLVEYKVPVGEHSHNPAPAFKRRLFFSSST
eukprot:SAG31_NODE_24488_length_480_cov_1.060367_1_plen_60_part_10